MESRKIRQTFIDFFKQKQHKIVPSAPMVVKNDPTLMFTNAGMNQFKDLFLGYTKVEHPRIADTQKCLRVSGKHNDLEEVGVDTYHHTMFEMLGNWSFGEYFKKEAITWAWELLVDVYGIDKTKLYLTVFEGNEQDGTPFDEEAYILWKTILEKNGLSEDHILKCDKKDNFWEMGQQGPCGPCSEIHIDIRSEEEIAKTPGKELVNQDHPQVIEIWNLVFMEFNRMANGDLKPLPAKHVDTGMGFERLAMVLQGKKSNYDTDVFSPIIEKITLLSGITYTSSDTNTDVAIRVIADHLRAVAFSIADGQLPSNTGAGYVIRRILRRAIRYGYSFLGLKEPFINQLVEILVNLLSEFFPELGAQQQLINKVIKEEEESFLRTLEKGIQRFETYLASANDKTIDGKFSFELYDTFGFPIDLTELLATENGFTIDMSGFREELSKQKERSTAAGKIETEDWVQLKAYHSDSYQNQNEEGFIGYDHTEATIYITQYRKVKIKDEEWVQLVFNVTPFYPEGGGQVGDTGFIQSETEKITIVNTKKENNLIVHYAPNLPIDVDTKYKAIVDNKRILTACNHTATHLMHQALRTILGTHVEQKGSLVNEDYLRFDFSHFEKLTNDQLREIEKFVNAKIQAHIPLNEHRAIPISKAEEDGAMMLFGEKYGDIVRMIQFDDSKELCGGIHVKNTKEIQLFKIKSEGSVASGIRRIEALTSSQAKTFIKEKIETVLLVKATLEGIENVQEIVDHLDKLNQKFQQEIDENINTAIEVKEGSIKEKLASAISILDKLKEDGKTIKEKLSKLKSQLAKSEEQEGREQTKAIKEELLSKIEKVNGVSVIAQKIELNNSAAIKDLAFQLKGQIKPLFLVLGTEIKGKPNLTVVVSEDLVKEKELHAGNIIKEIAKEIQGGGGGQAFYATAGGNNVEGIETAINKAKAFLNE